MTAFTRVYGRGSANDTDRRRQNRVGYAFIHSAIDTHSRLAYSEIHDDERAVTAVGFFIRAKAFYEAPGITIERVLTDNGSYYRSRDFEARLVVAAIVHSFTRLYRPATNRKIASIAPWSTNGPTPAPTVRNQLVDARLTAGCIANNHGHHTAVGGPPISRVNNVVDQDT